METGQHCLYQYQLQMQLGPIVMIEIDDDDDEKKQRTAYSIQVHIIIKDQSTKRIRLLASETLRLKNEQFEKQSPSSSASSSFSISIVHGERLSKLMITSKSLPLSEIDSIFINLLSVHEQLNNEDDNVLLRERDIDDPHTDHRDRHQDDRLLNDYSH